MTAVPPLRATRFVDGMLGLFLLGSGSSIGLIQGAGGVAGLVWLAGALRRGGRPRLPLLRTHLVFLGVSIIAAAAATVPGAAFYQLKSEWIPILIFLVMANRAADPARVVAGLRILLAAGGLMALTGFYQTWTHGLAHRIDGTLGHYMTYSENVMLIGLVLLGWLLFAPRDGVGRLVGHLVRVTVLLAMAVALVLTQTRGAWLGTLAGVATLVALRRPRWLIALPVLAVVAYFVAPQAARMRIDDLIERRDVTSVERVYMWRAAAAMTADHPLTGVGPDNFPMRIGDYRLPGDPWPLDRELRHAHNNPLQLAAERGLLGLSAWMAIWVVWLGVVVRGWRALAPGDLIGRAVLAGSIAATVGFHVAGLTEYTWGDTEVMYVASAFMGAGMATSVRGNRPALRHSATSDDAIVRTVCRGTSPIAVTLRPRSVSE